MKPQIDTDKLRYLKQDGQNKIFFLSVLIRVNLWLNFLIHTP